MPVSLTEEPAAARGGGRIEENADARQIGGGLLDELKPLAAHLGGAAGEAGDVAAGMGEAFDETIADRIVRRRKHDRDGLGGGHHGCGLARRSRQDDVRLDVEDLLDRRLQPVRSAKASSHDACLLGCIARKAGRHK
jgi:hypothetical protein